MEIHFFFNPDYPYWYKDGKQLRSFNDRKWSNPWWEAVCARKSWEAHCLHGEMSLRDWKQSRGYV